MNNNQDTKSNFLLSVKDFIREKLKIIITICIIIFILFLSFQIFSYYKVSQVQKDSIKFFNAKNLNDKEQYNKLMEELSTKDGFYSVLSNLELIKFNLLNKNFDLVLELYQTILNKNNLEKSYISAIATAAAYNFIDIQYNNESMNFLSEIQNFINLIDDNLESYKDSKLELKYLLAVTKIDLNNLSYSNDPEVSILHNQIMESETTSETIKERVNKIHEFQLYN